MIRLLVYAENLMYRYGGAEKSTFILLESIKRSGKTHIKILSGWSKEVDEKAEKYPYEDIEKVKVERGIRLPYLRYLLNSFRVRAAVKRLKADLLFAENMSAPAAINSFQGPAVYFVHDEFSVNSRRCYDKRMWKKIKFTVRFIFDLPFYVYYRTVNGKAMKRAALVVANSRYIAAQIKREFGIVAHVAVAYERVNSKRLSSLPALPPEKRPYIMMVGDAEVKGVSIFKKIAALMPDERFLMVGKTYDGKTIGNITYHGFVKDIAELYGKARLVLMPSLWQEAFGMVSVEAAAMGIPVLVTDRGGLPETVPSGNYVMKDAYDIEGWVDKIHHVLENYKAHSEEAREHALKLDMSCQIPPLMEKIKEVTGTELM